MRLRCDGHTLGHHLRTVPSPSTRYLKLVSCSAPTGPRACSLPVAMPISAPMPNSPPSANWVEALRIRIALSSRSKKHAAALSSSVRMQSGSTRDLPGADNLRLDVGAGITVGGRRRIAVADAREGPDQHVAEIVATAV